MDKNEKVLKEKLYAAHKRIPDAYNAFREGRVSRREFIRFSTLLGLSVGFATACSSPTPQGADAPAVEEEAEAPAESTGSINRGGTLTISGQLQLLDHPARLSWVQGANVVRQVAEYLTFTRPDNITIPYLLDRWEANDDVSEWTLYLKQGILFNNGDELTADDIMFNFGEWLDPEVGSSMLGLLSYLDGMNSVEKVDDYTVKLNLTASNFGVPDHLFHYPAAIMHRDFEGDFIQQPIGTGAFTLDEFVDGERAVVKARSDYWQMGEDGSPLPYLDEIRYVSIDQEAGVAGLQSGQIDTMFNPSAASWLALKDNPDLSVTQASTAQVLVLRARVDLEPWNDVRVLNALRKVQ
ncbi:MAG: ABC transporter substrate-binding protein, partial [Chloroflexota bacterium]